MRTTVSVLLIILSFVNIGCNKSREKAMKYFEAGNAEMKASNLINSIVYYNKAIALDSTQAEMFMARGNARLTTVDYEGATKDYTKVIQLDPGRAEAYLLRAMIKVYKKDYSDEAVADLNKAILINSNLAKAYYYLGIIQYVRHDSTTACNNLRKAADMGFAQAMEKIARYCQHN